MKKIHRNNKRFASVLLAGVLTGLLVAGIHAESNDGIPPITVEEYDRMRISAQSATYSEPSQSKAVLAGDFNAFLTVMQEDSQKAYAPVMNYYTVFTLNRETYKKTALFNGIVSTGSADLLLDEQENLLVVSGGSTYDYYGSDSEERVIAEICRYDRATGISNGVRSFNRFAFGEGSHYRYVTCAIDSVHHRVFAFYLSGDGQFLSVASYDTEAMIWLGVSTQKLPQSALHVYALSGGNGEITLVLTADNAASFVTGKGNLTDGIPTLTAVTPAPAHTLTVADRGDVYLDAAGALHILAADPESGAYYHITGETVTEVPLLDGAAAVRSYLAKDGARLLFSIPQADSGLSLKVLRSGDETLDGLLEAQTFTSVSVAALKPGSFQISNARSGSAPADSVLCVWAGTTYTATYVKVG